MLRSMSAGELSAIDGALQDAEGFGAAGQQPAVGEGGDEFRIRLAAADERAQDAATGAAEDARQALHLGAKVFAGRSRYQGKRVSRTTEDMKASATSTALLGHQR